MLNPALEQIAARVVTRANRELPADTALRNELRSHRGLARSDGARIAQAVFAYYRWRGWLDLERPPVEQIRKGLELADEFKAQPDNLSDEELVQRAVPTWIHREMNVNTAWIRTIQSEPKLWLRAKRNGAEALAAKLGAAQNAYLPDALLYEGADDLFGRPEFHAGEFEIQDLTSQAVGLLCDPKPGETWWDACAGEGGKTLHLSELMENRGLIWASDRILWRSKMLKRRAARARCFNYRPAFWNGGEKLPTRTQFDGVLIDAPCSGVGTWQRNPHARWTTTPEDLEELSEIQKSLLLHAAPAVKTGGRLIYAVCTLTRAETVEVLEVFERQFPLFKPLLMTNPFMPAVNSAPLWLTAEQTGGNGMFIAGWKKS